MLRTGLQPKPPELFFRRNWSAHCRDDRGYHGALRRRPSLVEIRDRLAKGVPDGRGASKHGFSSSLSTVHLFQHAQCVDDKVEIQFPIQRGGLIERLPERPKGIIECRGRVGSGARQCEHEQGGKTLLEVDCPLCKFCGLGTVPQVMEGSKQRIGRRMLAIDLQRDGYLLLRFCKSAQTHASSRHVTCKDRLGRSGGRQPKDLVRVGPPPSYQSNVS